MLGSVDRMDFLFAVKYFNYQLKNLFSFEHRTLLVWGEDLVCRALKKLSQLQKNPCPELNFFIFSG